MGTETKIYLPDLGDFQDVAVIEVLVAPGDRVAVESSLLTLESDKATMEIPSPHAGTVKQVLVKVGDKISQGHLVAILDTEAAAAAPADAAAPRPPAPAAEEVEQVQAPAPAAQAAPTARPQRRRVSLIGAAAILLLFGATSVFFAGPIYRFVTDQGTLVIETCACASGQKRSLVVRRTLEPLPLAYCRARADLFWAM